MCVEVLYASFRQILQCSDVVFNLKGGSKDCRGVVMVKELQGVTPPMTLAWSPMPIHCFRTHCFYTSKTYFLIQDIGSHKVIFKREENSDITQVPHLTRESRMNHQLLSPSRMMNPLIIPTTQKKQILHLQKQIQPLNLKQINH